MPASPTPDPRALDPMTPDPMTDDPMTDDPTTTEPPAPRRPPALVRIGRWLRAEDVLMAAVGAVGIPLVVRLAGSGGGPVVNPDAPTPLMGLAGLVAILGVLVCLCTRGAGEPAPFGDGELTLEGWARFPLLAGIGIVALETLPGIGLDGDPFIGITFLVVTISVLAYRWLPILPVVARRALVTPMAILAAGAFDQLMGSGLSDVVRGLLTGQAPPEVSAFLPIILGAVAVMYIALVVAPRAIADPGASWLAWAVRFVFLLGAVATGSLLFGVAT